MRILFLTLLVLNLGFLGYHLALGGEEPETGDAVLPGQDVATLEPLPPLAQSGGSDVPSEGPPGDEQSTSEAGATDAPAATTADPEEESEGEKVPRTGQTETGSTPGIASTPESGSGPKVKTVTAPPSAADVATATNTEDSGSPEPSTSAEETRSTCYALGPLNPDLRDRIEGRVAGTPMRVVERWQGDHAEPRYWVHLPPAPDMAGARERQEALKAAGYRDILLVRNGDMARSISLGLFADRANAAQHQQRLQADGFDARITEQSRHTSAPFLGLEVPEDAREALDGVRRLIEPEEAALTERPCDRLHEE